jgi:hypothetical protein
LHLLGVPPRGHKYRRDNGRIPSIGNRIEIRQTGVWKRGTVHYADDIQVLVKWDDGSSSSLRVSRDAFEIVKAT